MKTIVCACGMHRSGTSALAGLLHSNGITMGKILKPGASKQNPKGFYENYEFRIINDRILGENGYRTKSYNFDIPTNISITLNLKKDMIDLLSKNVSKYNLWGWKDPRNCLTLRVWIDVIRECHYNKMLKIIVVSRDTRSVALSMLARRNAKSIPKLEKLVNIYTSRLNSYLENFPIASILRINYKDLCESTKATANLLSTFLNCKINNLSFISSTLRHF